MRMLLQEEYLAFTRTKRQAGQIPAQQPSQQVTRFLDSFLLPVL